MVYTITKENIDSLKNEGLKADAKRYIDQYENFLEYIKESGAGISGEDYSKKEQELLKKLAEKGAQICNSGKSVVINAISPSCEHCHTGMGSATYILTLKCNRDCFFCTNKNQADYAEGVNKVYDIISEFKTHLGYYKKMKSVGITGGEPLLYPDKCIEFLKEVKKSDKTIQTRIYTNGDLVTEEIMQSLKDAGLDEIRFGLKPDENGKEKQKSLDNLALAVKYIKRTMVEMPLMLGKVKEMEELMMTLDKIGIFGINVLEFLYPYVHPDEYKNKGYEVSKRPYKVLYPYTYAGGVPIAQSNIECLEVMLYCLEHNVKMGMHYCSLENKLTAQLYQSNHPIKMSEIEYFSEKDFFLKTAKGYGDDAAKIKAVLDDNKVDHYMYDTSNKVIEFSPTYITLLKDYDMELGLTYLAVDFDEEYGRKVLREYQIDKVEPKTFELSDI